MLDILMPTSVANVRQAVQCVDALCEQTDVPFRIIAVVDGGTRQDIRELEGRLMGGADQFEWQLKHEQGAYFNGCLLSAMEEIRNQYVALVPAEAHVVDPEWFGKMQMPFTKDPHTYMVDGIPNTQSATMYPAKRDHHHLAKDCRFFVSNKMAMASMKAAVTPHHPDVIVAMQRAALQQGGTLWCAQGARFHITDHEEHAACPAEFSAEATRLELPSSTTPD